MMQIEREIWQAAKKVFNNPTLRWKDILEWSNSEERMKKNLEPGEVTAKVFEVFWATILEKHDKRKATR